MSDVDVRTAAIFRTVAQSLEDAEKNMDYARVTLAKFGLSLTEVPDGEFEPGKAIAVTAMVQAVGESQGTVSGIAAFLRSKSS